jgi:hypothetical protein
MLPVEVLSLPVSTAARVISKSTDHAFLRKDDRGRAGNGRTTARGKEVMVLVAEAREAARAWVITEGVATPGFRGAFLHGLITSLAAAAALPPASDVDLIVVQTATDRPPRRGKFLYRGALLDVSSLPADDLRSPEQVLDRYDLAGSLRGPSVIADPTGQLTALQRAVAAEFAHHRWVARRCADARERVLRYSRSLDQADTFPDQVTAWLFAAGVTTHILLAAGLRNPTVRTRYLAVRDLLADHGRRDDYETLLNLLGCRAWTRERAERHFPALAAAFDAAQRALTTPFPFAGDISAAARPIAIDGTRELIARGDHREAVFWMVATYARCLKTLACDASPATREQHAAGFRRLLADLGIDSISDLQHRREDVVMLLPTVMRIAGAIIAANPAITDGPSIHIPADSRR